MGEQVEPALRAPVEHAGRAAVADLDEPGLLQALQRLADRVAVDGERLREQALGGERLAGGVAAAQDRGAELLEDGLGDGAARDGLEAPSRKRVTDWTS